MFSHGLNSLKNAASTETRFTWRRTDRGSETTSQPKTIARPASGVRSVARILISVDLPLPFGPRIPVTPPAWTVRSSSCRAGLSFHSRFHHGAPVSRSRRLNPLVTPRSWIAAAFISSYSCEIGWSKQKGPCGAQQPHGPFWSGSLGLFLAARYRIRLIVQLEKAGSARHGRRSSSRPATIGRSLLDGHTRVGVEPA